MNMSQEIYKQELKKQISNIQAEITALTNDYNVSSDDITKSQIKTFLEKKQHLYLDLLERYYGIIK